MNIIKTEEEERKLYTELYDGCCCETTGYWHDVVDFILATSRSRSTLLDIGCGHGDVVKLLSSLRRNCLGVDISLAGIASYGQLGPEYDKFLSILSFREAPVWDMPYLDNQFDYTFSFDVLEHIPTDTVPAAIREIYRVTRGETFHCIATIPSEKNIGIHKTVQPIAWWEKQFAALNRDKVETHICSHREFLLLHDYLCKRRLG